ncbi:MAG: DUF3426 domain-containing protein [Methylobacter sp.]|nr:DUF3426 domain-containing protein [Methylobacter sp.]
MKASSANSPRFAWDQENSPSKSYWRLALVMASLLLVGQIGYFEGAVLIFNPTVRLILEKTCWQLDCRLPAYKNSAEFAVLQSSLTALPGHNRQFRAIIRNQALFAQPYPNLELTFRDYSGNPIARRVFRPQHYLPNALVTSPAIFPDASTAISLDIAVPKSNFGGYTFELIY